MKSWLVIGIGIGMALTLAIQNGVDIARAVPVPAGVMTQDGTIVTGNAVVSTAPGFVGDAGIPSAAVKAATASTIMAVYGGL
jgi:hypothetical protein